jgi:hypothetical protein
MDNNSVRALVSSRQQFCQRFHDLVSSCAYHFATTGLLADPERFPDPERDRRTPQTFQVAIYVGILRSDHNDWDNRHVRFESQERRAVLAFLETPGQAETPFRGDQDEASLGKILPVRLSWRAVGLPAVQPDHAIPVQQFP